MKNYNNTLLVLAALIAYSIPVQSQDLDLFQEIDVPTRNRGPATRTPARVSAENGEPAFTLKGTSKIGNNYHGSLIARNGDSVAVVWTAGADNTVPGFNGYRVTNIGSRTVSLSMPSGESCIESLDNGVSCNPDGTSLLSLSNLPPIQGQSTARELARVAPGSDPRTRGRIPTANLSPAEIDDLQSLDGNGPGGNTAGGRGFAGRGGGGRIIDADTGQPATSVTRQAIRLQSGGFFLPEGLDAEGLNNNAQLSLDGSLGPDSEPQAQELRSEDLIQDYEPPDGMRVVRTPFGPRLVPE